VACAHRAAAIPYPRQLDWIEELLGISPDAGTGLTEMLFALVVVLALVAIAVRVAASRRPAR